MFMSLILKYFYFPSIISIYRKYFMEIRNLITFTKVAESQSLSKAAKELGYAQSTVTMQMQQLEQELGISLYERVGKQIRITQSGQEFLSYATAIVRMSEQALMIGRQDDSAITGSLRLGILAPLSGKTMSSRIARYIQAHPQVDVVVTTVRDPKELLDQLRHNTIDLAITLDLPYTDPDLIHSKEDQSAMLHVFAGISHPLSDKEGLSQEDIFRYPFIRTGYFDAACSDKSAFPNSRQLQISDLSMALSITAESTGTAGHDFLVLAPDFIAKEHPAAKTLTRLDYEPSTSKLWIQVLCHRNKWLTKAMKSWLSHT